MLDDLLRSLLFLRCFWSDTIPKSGDYLIAFLAAGGIPRENLHAIRDIIPPRRLLVIQGASRADIAKKKPRRFYSLIFAEAEPEDFPMLCGVVKKALKIGSVIRSEKSLMTVGNVRFAKYSSRLTPDNAERTVTISSL